MLTVAQGNGPSEAAHPRELERKEMLKPESRDAQQRKPDLLLAVKFKVLTLELLSTRLHKFPR